MGKMIPLRQTMDVEALVTEYRVGGLVTHSNFIEEGERQLLPVEEEVLDALELGDKLRITFFSNEDDVEHGEGGNSISFKPRTVKYERWNEDNGGWDQIYERQINS